MNTNSTTDYFVVEYHIYNGVPKFYYEQGPYGVQKAMAMRDDLRANCKTDDVYYTVESRDKGQPRSEQS